MGHIYALFGALKERRFETHIPKICASIYAAAGNKVVASARHQSTSQFYALHARQVHFDQRIYRSLGGFDTPGYLGLLSLVQWQLFIHTRASYAV